VVAVVIGVGATLGWQSYGDQVREKLAGALPQQLGWLVPGHAAGTKAAGSSAPSADRQQLQELSDRVTTMGERLDQLSQRVAALGTLLSRAGAGSPTGAVVEPGQRVEAPFEQTGNPPKQLVAASSPAAASGSPPAGGAVELRPRIETAVEQTGNAPAAGSPARAQPSAAAPSRPDPEQKQPQVAQQTGPASSVSQEEACKHDAARLARLRMSQARDEVAVFERDLACEELRPQVLRLRESIDP
jgi:hypothetical protein